MASAAPAAQAAPPQSAPPAAGSNKKPTPSKPTKPSGPAPVQSTSHYVGTAKVLFEFIGTQPGELTAKDGDIAYVLNFDDGNGWMTAEIRGKKGVIPANYVEVQFKPSPVPKGGLAERGLLHLGILAHLGERGNSLSFCLCSASEGPVRF